MAHNVPFVAGYHHNVKLWVRAPRRTPLFPGILGLFEELLGSLVKNPKPHYKAGIASPALGQFHGCDRGLA